MTKLRLKELLSVVSLAALLVCVLVPFKADITKTESSDVTVPTYTAAVAVSDNQKPSEHKTVDEAVAVSVRSAEPTAEQESVKTDAAQLERRFISMLSINHGFNSVFADESSVAKCAAVSLSDYACDIVGYGRCVNVCLVEGFAKSFYGITLSAEALTDPEAPSGYISLPGMGMDTNAHTLVSVTETEEGFEVLTCMRSYEGGGDYETCLVKSVFVENSASEFGFNLISCETL